MKIEKKAKGKGKAIIGIAMAVIMLASVFVAMMPMGIARETTPGLAGNEIEDGDTVYIGEQGLKFDTDGDSVYGGATDLDFVLEGVPDTPTEGEILTVDTQGWTVPFVTRGKYTVAGIPADGAGLEPGDAIYIDEAKITGDIILNHATPDSIVGRSVPTSAEIVFKVEMNFGGRIPYSEFKIVVTTPNGLVIETIDGQSLRHLDATLGTTLYVTGLPAPWDVTTTAPPYPDAIDLASMDTGTYKVKIKTEKTTCNMLDVSSAEMEFTVRSMELSIEAAKDTVGKGEDIIVKVNGNPRTLYYLIVTGIKRVAPGETSVSPEIMVTQDVDTLDAFGAAYPATATEAAETNLAAWIQTGSDGVADIKIATTGADDRTYTIKVYELPAAIYPAFAPDATVSGFATDDDEVDVKVVKAEVTFDIPISAVIGEEVTIKGSISAGDRVDIIIKDQGVVADDEPVDENNEFEVKWDTAGCTTGSYTVEAYIDEMTAVILADYDAIDDDGKTMIRLVAPGLTAEQPRNVVAEGDFYTIEGIATGTDDVDYILIGPKGWKSGTAPGLVNGILVSSTSVSDNEFSEDITMTAGLDIGMWVALVLAPGRDGVYETNIPTGAGGLAVGSFWPELVAGMNQDQCVAIIKDQTAEAVGSDDLLVGFSFKVESPRVELDPIASVAVGEPLVVTGTTNREPGTIIMISTFAGPTDLPVVITEVEWPTPYQGIFNATIDTTYAVAGTYTLEADDGDGHTDTATVEILPPKPPTPEVSVSTDKKEYSLGDVMMTSIRISNPADDTQKLSFKWYLGIHEYDLWTEMRATPLNLPAGYDQTVTVPIPVGNWGTESFCGCHVVSLTDTTTRKVVSVDSAAWIYTPGAVSDSKTTAEIAKEIKKGVEGVEL